MGGALWHAGTPWRLQAPKDGREKSPQQDMEKAAPQALG